ncbi:jerky protein homolog-like [Bactrocera neohumeralis]|uniref:jerky protein homolog-like n=1 Tax=Bactrocera neohumeralis TaxID=98809 RepID=UPI002165012B|nr:jerky protein homolog-like [Bactrocera neohumeralis]
MSNKRKKNTLSLETKVKILEKLDKGVQGNRLALDFNVSKSAISYIKSNRSSILNAVSNTYQEASNKTVHSAEYPKMESRLYEWFLKQRERKCTLTATILKEKAKQIFGEEYPDKNKNAFRASDGWFTKFKKRHGIRFLKIGGEILSSDIASITPFIHRFRAKVTEMGLIESQLYNVDETGLFYRCLPDKTYVSACEKSAPGYKIQKERISILLGSNADGSHKLVPLVIGKAKNPRSFKGFKNPLHYNFSKNAWMTSRIFHDWFHKIFINEVIQFSQKNNLPPKALLLIDNCSAHAPIEHLQSKDGNIVAYFLPPNVTAAVQPMDKNPIKLTKLVYRSKLLAEIIAEGGALNSLLKSHSIRKAIIFLKQAWDEITPKVMRNSWSKLLNWDSDQYDSDDDVPLAELLNKNEDCNESLQVNQTLLAEIDPNSFMCIADIEKWNEDEFEDRTGDDLSSDDEFSDSSEDDVVDDTPVISNVIAIESVNNLINWCNKSELSSSKHMTNLLALRNDIVISDLKKPKNQTNITDYMSNKN